MALDNTLKVYENRVLISKDAFTGAGSETFYTVKGSRMLITLKVLDADPSAVVNVFVDNTFDLDAGYDTLETLSITGPGTVKRVISDFNNVFQLRYTITGGMATVRVAVALYDNASTTRIENAQLSVSIDHTTDSLGHFDSVRIGDGADLLAVNPDGSVNAVIVDDANEQEKSYSNRITGVAAGTTETLLTYTVPALTETHLTRCEVSGDNIAQYELFLNGAWLGTKRTSFGEGLNTTFEFMAGPKRGQELQPGDTLEVIVTHNRPAAGAFEARLQVLERA